MQGQVHARIDANHLRLYISFLDKIRQDEIRLDKMASKTSNDVHAMTDFLWSQTEEEERETRGGIGIITGSELSNSTNSSSSSSSSMSLVPFATTEEDEIYEYDYDESTGDLPLLELLSVSFVYGLTFVLGAVGNCLVIVCIARFRRMHNVTNIFLVSLATADLLLVCLCIPIKVGRLHGAIEVSDGIGLD